MRILYWAIGGIAVLVVAFVAIGMLLPRNIAVARSIEISASPDDVFPHVNSLKAAAEWSPWLERDPNVVLSYSGPDAGVGAKLEWASDVRDVGNGAQEIVKSEPSSHVESALDFGEMGVAKAAFVLNEAGDMTRVTWSLEADMGAGPMGRWMGLMMDDWVGADYEAGLARLKTLVEGG